MNDSRNSDGVKGVAGPVDVIEGRTLLHIETAATAPQPGLPVCSVRKDAAGYAWAGRIVQCLNSHDELLEALELAANRLARCALEGDARFAFGCSEWEREARAVIAKARGGTA